MSDQDALGTEPASAWILLPEGETAGGSAAGDRAEVRVWGLSASERLARSLRRAGASRVEIVGPDAPLPEALSGCCAVFRADLFYDERLVAGLLAAPATVLVGASGPQGAEPDDAMARPPLAAHVAAGQLQDAVAALRAPEDPNAAARLAELRRVEPEDLCPAFNAALRKHDPPYVFPARGDAVRETENRIFASAYKGITDLVTLWVFPLPARAVTRWLARRGVRPNTITWISYALVAIATWLFAEGWFAVGLVTAWLMTFLDTVDGKLARVTITSSTFGHALDHGLDLVHPPIWWLAFGYGLAAGESGLGSFALPTLVIVGGYVIGRLLEGVFLLAFKQEIFTWRPFDAFFRQIIARRNPNLILLSLATIAGRPELGFQAVAAWTAICLLVHAIRLAQAFTVRVRGGAIRPWYETLERDAASQTGGAA